MKNTVKGYRKLKQEDIDLVNDFKAEEEKLLRALDFLKECEEVDQRWLAVGRTALEQAFMAINRSIFKPERVRL